MFPFLSPEQHQLCASRFRFIAVCPLAGRVFLSGPAERNALPSLSCTCSGSGIETGEGPLRVAATCLIGIVAPMLGGFFIWRYATAHFDRLVGRPWRQDPVEEVDVAAKPARGWTGLMPQGLRIA